MREVLDIYDLKGKYLGREERQKFYKKNRTEFDKKGVIKSAGIIVTIKKKQKKLYKSPQFPFMTLSSL